jgi:hypothetical protein
VSNLSYAITPHATSDTGRCLYRPTAERSPNPTLSRALSPAVGAFEHVNGKHAPHQAGPGLTAQAPTVAIRRPRSRSGGRVLRHVGGVRGARHPRHRRPRPGLSGCVRRSRSAPGAPRLGRRARRTRGFASENDGTLARNSLHCVRGRRSTSWRRSSRCEASLLSASPPAIRGT